MRLSLEWLRSYVRLTESAPKVAQLLTERSFETVVGSSDTSGGLLEADVLPNRAADCLSHLGIARELGAILQRKVVWPDMELTALNRKSPFALRVGNTTLCPRFLAVLVEGVRGDAQSPAWMRRRLQAVGVRPQNLIVDVTNYVLWEVGQPTHAFDARAIRRTLGVRPSRSGETVRTLDGVTRKLSKGVLVLTSDDQPIDVAGIMGGEESSVHADTTAIVLTAGLFDRVAVRKASQALNLRTDASDRFAKGRTAAHVEAGAARVLALLRELAGARATAMAEAYPRPMKARAIRVTSTEVEALLGLQVPIARQRTILTALGGRVSVVGKTFRVTPPLFRNDLAIPEDIAEEVGRIVGLAKIPARLPRAPLKPATLPDDLRATRILEDQLKAAGWTETLSYSFSTEEETLALGFEKVEHLKIVNPINRDQIRLRVSLLPNLLHHAWAGAKKTPLLRLFEVGRVYLPGPRTRAPRGTEDWKAREPLRLAGLLIRRGDVASRQREDFYEVKGIVEQLLTTRGLSDVWFDDVEPSPEGTFAYLWQPGRSAEVKVGQKAEVGFVGVVAPKVLERLRIRGSAVAFDLDLAEILTLEKAERVYQPPLPYPPVLRDLSLLVPETVLVDTLMEAIGRVGAPLVQDVDFVDLYEGSELPEGRRSVTLRITYGSPERTLTDKEVNDLHRRIVASLEEEFGVEER